jgi:hypothetical protein
MGSKTDAGKKSHVPEIQALVISKQSSYNDRIQEKYTDAVEIPEMKRHTWDDPIIKGRWTLDQGKNAIDIGQTATHYDHCSAPPCMFLVNEQGHNNCKSKIEADMLDEHCTHFTQIIYKHIDFE